jgi:hypothetical protein
MTCDDFLVMLPTGRDFFFDEYNRPIYRIKEYKKNKTPYCLHIEFCNQLAYLATGKEYPVLIAPYHGIHPHSLKSITKTVTDSFLTPYYRLMQSHRFRKTSDMDHLMFALVGESRGEYWVRNSEIHEFILNKKGKYIKNLNWLGDVRMLSEESVH